VIVRAGTRDRAGRLGGRSCLQLLEGRKLRELALSRPAHSYLQPAGSAIQSDLGKRIHAAQQNGEIAILHRYAFDSLRPQRFPAALDLVQRKGEVISAISHRFTGLIGQAAE